MIKTFQAGPIDSIVRKSDKNGHLIALVTFKHVESVDYAVSLFNNILLFSLKLKVQHSQKKASQSQLQADLNKSSSSPAGGSTPLGINRSYSRNQVKENVYESPKIPLLQQQPLMQLMTAQFSPAMMHSYANQNLPSFTTPTHQRNQHQSRHQHSSHDHSYHQSSKRPLRMMSADTRSRTIITDRRIDRDRLMIGDENN
jgi:RNA recognition motif-containing protein